MTDMFRLTLVVIATLAASACGYGSDVDMAPMEERAASPVLASGDYCGVVADMRPYVVSSLKDCVRLQWNAADRTYTVWEETNGKKNSDTAAIVPLGGDLYLVQAPETPGAGKPRFQFVFTLAKGDAFAGVPLLDDDSFLALAKTHPGVSMRMHERDAIIAGGERPAIRALLRAAGEQALREEKIDDAREMRVAVRDTLGRPVHVANADQTRAVDDILKLLDQHKPPT